MNRSLLACALALLPSPLAWSGSVYHWPETPAAAPAIRLAEIEDGKPDRIVVPPLVDLTPYELLEPVPVVEAAGMPELVPGPVLPDLEPMARPFWRYERTAWGYVIDVPAGGIAPWEVVDRPMSTTPEPATWAGMITGLVLVGVTLRRRWRTR